MRISTYLVIKKSGNQYYPKYYPKYRVSKTTTSSPSLESNEVAIKVSVSLPDTVFDRPAFQAEIDVPEEAVNKPVISADVIDNVQEIIKQNTGFDVKLEAVGKEEDN